MKTTYNVLLIVTIICSLLFVVKSLQIKTSTSQRNIKDNCIEIFQNKNFYGSSHVLCNSANIAAFKDKLKKYEYKIRSMAVGKKVGTVYLYNRLDYKGKGMKVTKTSSNVRYAARSLKFKLK